MPHLASTPARPAPLHAECQPGWSSVSTALGPVVLVWDAAGPSRVLLPGSSPPEAPPEAPLPAWAEPYAAALRAAAAGQPLPGLPAPLPLHGLSEFQQAVLGACAELGPGQTATYGELARRLGRPGAARAVGGALGRNPFPLLIPCHRVLGAGGALVGFSAPGGVETKRRLLALEDAARAGG